MKISVAHDFICPWCWIGLLQAEDLKKEFGVEIEWLGYELFPDELEWPTPQPPAAVDERKPKTPSRLDLAYAAQQMEAPTAVRPYHMRTHNAHEAIEYAKTQGLADALNDRFYRAYWEEGREINHVQVIEELARGIVPDVPDLINSIESRRFRNAIIGFDDAAYESGIFNVPTFIIGRERYAEEPYSRLKKAVEAQLVPR